MPRSSRHRSHRLHKHKDERDRSDSDEDGNSRERKPREEEPATSSGVRVSRDLELERRKSSHSSLGKDLIGSSNGDISGEHGRKRKEREEDVAVSDRWKGGGDDDVVADKKSKEEEFGPVDLNKSLKSKLSASDSKGRSSTRRDGSSGRHGENGGKVDSVKRRPDKDSSWRESDSQYKETKDRGRERASDRDKKTQDSRHTRSDDVVSRKHSSRTGSTVEEHATKKDIENSESQVQHEFQNPDFEKELGKRVRRRRDNSEDKDKWMGDGRESDDQSDRRLSTRADHSKNKNYRDERHQDGKYRDKYRVDVDRDQKHQDDKRQDEHSCWDHIGERSDNKHYRDENMPSESHCKKSKIQDNDLDGSPYVDDRDTKLTRGRKRFSEGSEDHSDLKTRSAKEPHEDADNFFPSRIDSHTEKPRSEHRHSDKVDSSPINNRPKSSACSSAYAVKDHSRHKSKQADSACRESPSEERICRSTASTGDCPSAIRDRERVSDSHSSDKFKSNDRIHFMETAAASQYDRKPRSDAYSSPNKLREKSPSTSKRRYPDRTSARQSFDNEVRQKRYSSRNGDRELPLDGPILDDQSQTEICNREPTPGGSSSINRTGPFSSSSPNHLLPPPHVRLGIDSPVLGSYEEDNRVQVGDRKSYNRQRSGDISLRRGHGNAWKSGPAWPPPIANGFMPLQHGPPAAGFHPAMQQFPGPALFGVRPSMDLSHTGISYHMHEVSDRFRGHGRSFGWHNPVDGSCLPHLQVWDGSNGVFGDESQMYGRPEWDQNRHVIGSRGGEMNADTWKGQNGNIHVDFPVSQKEPEPATHALADEAWVRQASQHSSGERARTEHLPSEGIDAKQSSDAPSVKNAVGSPPNTVPKKIPESSKTPGDDNANLCAKYLSRIDISLDLADTELYKKCMSLLGKLEITDACNKSMHEHSQNNKEDIRVRRQGASHSFSSLFPTKKDAIFQRAISLYKKQNGRSKVSFPASLPVCSENTPPANELRDMLDDAGVANGANSLSIMEETKNTAANVDVADSAGIMKEAENTTTDSVGANFARNMEEVEDVATDADGASSASDMEVAKNTITDADVHLGDAKEQQSNFVSDSVVFANGSPTCQALKAECRVNLSRIHNSPGSTH